MIRIISSYDDEVPFHPDITDYPHVAEVIRGERKFRYTERLFRRSESLQTQYYNNIYRKKKNGKNKGDISRVPQRRPDVHL
jgi:hypothetical protein